MMVRKKLSKSLGPEAQKAPKKQKANHDERKRGKTKAAKTKRVKTLDTSESSVSDPQENNRIAWRAQMSKILTNNRDSKYKNQTKKHKQKRGWAKMEENKDRNFKKRKAKNQKKKKVDAKKANKRRARKEAKEKEQDKRQDRRRVQIQNKLKHKLKMRNGSNVGRNKIRSLGMYSQERAESRKVIENASRLQRTNRLPKIRNSYKIRQSVFEMDKKISQDPGKLKFHLRQIFSNFLDREVILILSLNLRKHIFRNFLMNKQIYDI